MEDVSAATGFEFVFQPTPGSTVAGPRMFEFTGGGVGVLDYDLDGWPDLWMTQGRAWVAGQTAPPHFAMRLQFYRNEGQGRFQELLASTLGPFFSREHLGRGLARLDWNRDGREDVAISHIGTPAALLENRTTVYGRFLSLTLVGRQSPREPIGAVITANCGSRTLTKQLTAGDGYHASNARTLHFGLENAQSVDRRTVVWPSGVKSTTENLAIDTEWQWIEGDIAPLRRP